MKVVIAEFRQESNSFSPLVSKLDETSTYRFFMDNADKSALDSDKTEIRGYYDEMSYRGADIYLSAAVGFGSSGKVPLVVYNKIMKQILDDISREKPEIVMITVHGAMIVEGDEDGSGKVLEEVRALVGNSCIIGTSVDMHANMTERILSNVDIVVGYKTYPHMDVYESGRHAASIAADIFLSKKPLNAAMVKLPLIIPAECGKTSEEPMLSIMKRAAEIESMDGVKSVTISAVQAWLNIKGVGGCVTVYAEDMEAAAKYAEELAAMMWSIREKAIVKTYSVEEAVQIARDTPRKPLLFVDSADSPSAGSTGDSSAAIKEIYKYADELTIYANVVDPAVAHAAINAGVGTKIKVKLGFGINPLFGEPFDSEWTVKSICNRTFEFKGPMFTGFVYDRGECVILQKGKLSVMVMENGVDNSDPELYMSEGLKIESADIIMLRSASAYRFPYEGLYSKDLYLDTMGASSPQIDKLPFDNIGWEIYPINKNLDFKPQAKVFHGRKI